MPPGHVYLCLEPRAVGERSQERRDEASQLQAEHMEISMGGVPRTIVLWTQEEGASTQSQLLPLGTAGFLLHLGNVALGAGAFEVLAKQLRLDKGEK